MEALEISLALDVGHDIRFIVSMPRPCFKTALSEKIIGSRGA
jgi:hypothetical protein